MRERLFSILGVPRYPPLAGACVLDLFAGSGALGIEAASRGAASVLFVDQSAAALKAIEQNIAGLGDACVFRAKQGDASRLEAADISVDTPADIIFMDPPYGAGLIPPTLQTLLAGGWLAAGGVIVAECDARDDPAVPPPLAVVDKRRQGRQMLLWLQQE